MKSFRSTSVTILVAVAALTACDPDRTAEADPQGDPAAVPAETRWNANPAADIRPDNGDGMVIETEPHTVVWPDDVGEVAPPYRVRVLLEKEEGRRHEGFGIIFGARDLTAAEEEQRYSYFLIRGDGSFLVRLRDGPEVPVILPWAEHEAIRPDARGENPENELAVEVGVDETRFLVNGEEVERVATAELFTRGKVGLRIAHDVRLRVRGFEVQEGGEGEGIAQN